MMVKKKKKEHEERGKMKQKTKKKKKTRTISRNQITIGGKKKDYEICYQKKIISVYEIVGIV